MKLLLVSSRAESFAQFLTAVLIFIFVLLVAYFTTRFVGKFQKSQLAYRNFEAIESFKIMNGKYLQLVKIGSKYVVIGIGKDNVTMICEVPEEEIKTASEQGVVSDAFRDILAKTKARISKRDGDDSHGE